MAADASAPPETTVTVVMPSAMPRTRPESSTSATRVSLDDHANPGWPNTWPLASVAVAERRAVSPTPSVSAAGDTLTEVTTWATVTVAAPVAEPTVAVIVADPLPVAVTSPPGFTVATDPSPLIHVIAAPAIT